MIANDTHEPDTNPAPVKSKTPEEGRELVEEADQRSQDMHMQRLLRDERIRLIFIGLGLFMIILSAALFLFTGFIVALFATVVVVPLFYRSIDVYLGKSEASARRRSDGRCKGINHKDLSRLHLEYVEL